MNFEVASIAFAVIFLIILTLLHFLKRELDPSWRMISEYEIGRFGWLMRVAFFCWGAAVLSLLVALWPSLHTPGGVVSRWWLALIVLALFGAGIFKTDPITDIGSGMVHRIHTLCGSIVILTFPIAATLAVHSLLQQAAWLPWRGWLIFTTVLAWLGFASFFATIIVTRIKDPTAGTKGGGIVYQGWPNRILVLTYTVWLIIVAAVL